MTASPGERGAVLGMVIVIAVTTAIGAYTLLTMAASQARQAQAAGVNVQHTQARYAAEGGLVWAQQRLFTIPTWGSSAGTIDVTIGGMGVDIITNPPCGAPPCPPRTLEARVDY